MSMVVGSPRRAALFARRAAGFAVDDVVVPGLARV
jgi:hypothetical protein